MPVSRRALLHFMFILSITFVLASVFRLTTIGFAHAASPAAQSQQPSAAPESDDSPGPAAPRPAASVVWVNTTSGYYHQPSSRHYGKTRHGKYMSESDAIRAGYRPARN
jgi:hypothetical protein